MNMHAMLAAVIIGCAIGLGTASDALAQQPSADRIVGARIDLTSVQSEFDDDQRWSQLGEEQRNRIRAYYRGMAEGDEPPYPESGLGAIARDVRDLHAAGHFDGQLVLSVLVDETGRAKSVSVFETPDRQLANAVAHIVMSAKYKPGRCAGTPCAMDFPYFFVFRTR